ncbi:MAG: phosphate starvation-inducible PhoH-like protein [Motiliproteus sp.]
MTTDTAVRFSLEPDNPSQLANLCGQLDEHLKLIESRLGIQIRNRGNDFQLVGDQHSTRAVTRMLHNLYQEAGQGVQLTPEMIHLSLQESELHQTEPQSDPHTERRLHQIKTPKILVKARGDNQNLFLQSMHSLDINFGIGPAGTGKTFLAVACAVEALERDEVRRIILVRPAVEAGEKLGFLPGDLAQKIDPYLRPLYDALFEMLGVETVTRLIERQVIEVAPLAYMRGRTLNHAFVILDESQNTTKEQMKMFLTRIGFGSTAVITGDITQIDLPRATVSGLNHATEVLKGVEGIGFTHFEASDVVRHPLVQRIVRAYDTHQQEQEQEQ